MKRARVKDELLSMWDARYVNVGAKLPDDAYLFVSFVSGVCRLFPLQFLSWFLSRWCFFRLCQTKTFFLAQKCSTTKMTIHFVSLLNVVTVHPHLAAQILRNVKRITMK